MGVREIARPGRPRDAAGRRARTADETMTNEGFRLGDAVRWSSNQGEVIGIIDRGEYRDPKDVHRWSALGRGVLVRAADGEIHHFRDASTVLRKM